MSDDEFTVELDQYEGPLALLLGLARVQRVDLRAISILALANQYLAWLERAEARNLELAADLLVLAAWLAFLKSALLLPGDPEAEIDPDQLAAQLHLRLLRLDAMREAGTAMMARDRMSRDVFARGAPEGLRRTRTSRWQCDLYEPTVAYGALRARTAPPLHLVAARAVVTLEEALAFVAERIVRTRDWTPLDDLAPVTTNDARPSALASTFVAALELARQGRVELRQAEAFQALELRRAPA